MKKLSYILLAGMLLALLAGCNLPQAQTPPAPDAIFTSAAETVQAQLTQEGLLIPQETTPAPPAADTSTPQLPTATQPATLAPSATPLCDLAQFVSDVTIPDGTTVLPGEAFTKTWRFRNIGTCAWTSGYQLIFDNGESMGGPVSQPLAGNVAPGQQVDLSVALKAPLAPGTYRGYWRLRNAAGVLLPVASGYQGTSFFVEIKVPTPTATQTLTPTPSATPTPTVTSTP